MAYSMMFTNMFGGPCPVCDNWGNLLYSFGNYGPQGDRNLIHDNPDGHVSHCRLPHHRGLLHTKAEGWYYEGEDHVMP